MSPEYNRKHKGQQPKSGWRRVLDGILERLREGLEDLAEGMRPARPQPQPIPIPVPVRRPRSRY